MKKIAVEEWIIHSNLIEGVYDAREDEKCQRAWEWFKDRPLSLDTIQRCHGMIMKGLLPASEAGRWRKCFVTVGGRLCPAPIEVGSLMLGWFHGWKDKDPIQNHVQFERIHPFVDGNGRIGRMILNWMRADAGLEPLLIMYQNRLTYYKWFNASPGEKRD
jgi:Fic family protein